MHHKAISLIYARCLAHDVLLEGEPVLVVSQDVYLLIGGCVLASLLKPSFPQPGLKQPTRVQVTSEEIAVATATLISRSVPSSVPGVVFLAGDLFISCWIRVSHFF